jgi:cytochrome oxidase Cu insertion factor (SCO1/SenC/PrrC family)
MDSRLKKFCEAAVFLVIASLMLTTLIRIAEAETNPQQPAQAESPWGGDYFPNIPLVTQDGQTVRFFDDLIKDKVVAVNFIFTSCTDSCPLETARLLEVQKLLGDRLGKDVFFYSISIDPETDTPAVLKDYAAKFGIDTRGWTFLTGKRDDITLLRQRLGLYMAELEGTRDHNLSLIVGNQKTGRWQKASPFENPYVLANQLGSVLHNWQKVSAKRNHYADAPTSLRQMSKGEQLFRTRCSSCHTVGKEIGSLAAQHSVGPDLQGVGERRPKEWLERWLKQPDRMIAEKDPTAIALLERYKVPMPNLRLNNVEVTALLEYLDKESRRLAGAPRQDSGHGGHGQHADPAEHAAHDPHAHHGDHAQHAQHAQHAAASGDEHAHHH